MYSRWIVLGWLALVGVGCASGPSTELAGGTASAGVEAAGRFDQFPADALRSAAAEIERQVAEGNREPALTAPDGLVVDTPGVRQAVRTRAARIELVNTMLDAGHAWERRNGRIWVLRTSEYKNSTTRRQRDIDAIMINGENRDRWTIYEGLIEANRLGRGALSDIEGIFFDARLPQLKPGQKYEATTGEQAVVAAPQ